MEFRDPMGRTALMEAAKHGHVACVHELLCRGADPTARSAVGWTASDFCGSHESQHGEINRLLGEAQLMWQQDRDKQHSQQMLPHQDSNKENNDSQLQIELPGYSTPSPRVPTATQHMFRSYSSQDEPTQYRVEEPAHFGMPQQQQYQVQHQPQQQQQLFQHPLLNPMLSQGMLAQATMARLSQAGSEPANSTLSSSMLSLRSSELSNGSNLSRELGLLPAGLHSPMGHHQQNPATLSKPVCRYWHSGRCLYGAHCRYTPSPLVGKTQGRHCSAWLCVLLSLVCAMTAGPLLMHKRIVWHACGFASAFLNAVCTCCILCTAWLMLPWPTKCCPMSTAQFLSLNMCLCRFAHPAGPAPTPPPSVQPVCRYWRFGTCRYGSACRFRSARQAACWHLYCDSGSSLHCSL